MSSRPSVHTSVHQRFATRLATLGAAVCGLGVVTAVVGLTAAAGWPLTATGLTAAVVGGYLTLTGLGAVQRRRVHDRARAEAELDARILAAAAGRPADPGGAGSDVATGSADRIHCGSVTAPAPRPTARSAPAPASWPVPAAPAPSDASRVE